jgi:single-strand DNA-binding protein
MNLNKVFILGNLAKDPEVRTIPSGQQVATFPVATNRVWYNQAKEKNQEVEFHNIVMWGKLAEIASKYLNKGKMVLIEGRIKTRSWQAQDGTKKYRTEIIAEAMQMGPKTQGTSSFSKPDAKEETPMMEESAPQDNSGEITTEEVPF